MKTKPAYLEFEGAPLFFDVVEKENQHHTATATESPVEEGANVSDHIRDNPATVTLDIFMSNTPTQDVNNMWGARVAGLELKVPSAKKKIAPTPGGLINAGFNALANALLGPEQWKAVVLQFDEQVNNVGMVFNTLLDWKERGVVGKVITPYRTYEKMCITGIEMNRDATTGDGAPITIELKAIRLVEAKLITAPIPTEDRGKTIKNKGRQPTSFVRDPGPKRDLFTQLGANPFRPRR